MLGLRSQYALSNALVANVRRDMHFLYLQDDLRFGRRLTLNLGAPLRVRDRRCGSWTTNSRTSILRRGRCGSRKDGSIRIARW